MFVTCRCCSGKWRCLSLGQVRGPARPVFGTNGAKCELGRTLSADTIGVTSQVTRLGLGTCSRTEIFRGNFRCTLLAFIQPLLGPLCASRRQETCIEAMLGAHNCCVERQSAAIFGRLQRISSSSSISMYRTQPSQRSRSRYEQWAG
jgi:hypothetical protein